MVHEQVAVAHRREDVRAAVVGRAEGGPADRDPGLVAQLPVAVDPVDLPQVGHVEQAVDVDDLHLLDTERLDQQLAQVGVHGRAQLEPDDLSEAPPPQLVLDGLEQVVGLVGDGEVGVAGDPEGVVAKDLHPGKELAEVAGDDHLQRHERAAVEPEEARHHLLGHLHAREGLAAGDRVAEPDSQRQRQVRDVGEGPARPNGERREDGEDLLAEDPVDLLESAEEHCSQSTMRMPCSASAGLTLSCQMREWRALSPRTRSAVRSITSAGDSPSGPRASMPASTWSCSPAIRTM